MNKLIMPFFKIIKQLKFLNRINIISLLLLILGTIATPITAFAADSFSTELEHILSSSSMTSRLMQIFLLITILGLAPSILIMVTSFVRITIVLSIVRTALGLQQTPPNQVLISLALFLTFFIMSPSLEES